MYWVIHDLCETVDSMFYLLVLYSKDNLSDCVKLVWIYDAGSKKGISVRRTRWCLSAGCFYSFEGQQQQLLHQQILNLMLLWEWGLSRNKSLFGRPPWAEFCIYHSWVGNEIKIYDRCLHHLNEVELSNLREETCIHHNFPESWNLECSSNFSSKETLIEIKVTKKHSKLLREVNTWRVELKWYLGATDKTQTLENFGNSVRNKSFVRVWLFG